MQDAIFSYLCYDYVLPCQFKFQGPVLGYVRSYAGYMAASDGEDQRPLENVNLYINLDTKEGLTVKINGIAGYIIEIDCSSKDQQFIKKTFETSFQIEVSQIPNIIDIRTADNIFERRFLGLDVASKDS